MSKAILEGYNCETKGVQGMSKIKIRCSQCSKTFKSANTKQLICPECEEKLRRERAAKMKGAAQPAPPAQTVGSRVISPKPATRPAPASHPKPHWLDQQQDVKVAAPEPAEPARPPRLDGPMRRPHAGAPALTGAIHTGEKTQPAHGALVSHEKQETRSSQRLDATSAGHIDQRPRKKSGETKREEGEKASQAKKSAGPAARARREPRPPTPPFAPTPEQVTAIEQRYLELAQPHEFDGIRSQISQELTIPKSAVKRVIMNLRQREAMPSWWDIQTYHGSPEDLERVREAYLPTLPLPPVGIHKHLAALLNLPPGVVYQAIKAIRAEMNLPQYNLPEQQEPAIRSKSANTSPENTTPPAGGES
jgi:DNA-directed RNA polymerase subunit RPC12/RpoP